MRCPIRREKGKVVNSNYDVVSLSNGVSSLDRVRLLSPILQHERSKY